AIMGLIPGVWVNVTGGEGYMTSIRQPLTTNPVYLYLEDGIPTRSTGFFNHNALYEINLLSASKIEVTKGPGSALYGSDAIGGVINVTTKSPKAYNGLNTTIEGGSYGWMRGLFEGNLDINDEKILTSFNATKTDGWRDATDYERYSGSVRWDHNVGSRGLLKTIISYSKIDQSIAGSSAISKEDYFNNPTINYTPISFRKVDALRISLDYANEFGNSLISIIPYFRYNSMDLLPNWTLTFDPTSYNTKNNSLGLLAKYRIDFTEIKTKLITGVDFDFSPGSKFEQRINPVREGKIFTSYTTGETIYDYDVTFFETAPYIHIENSYIENLYINGGIRMDYSGYNYTTNIQKVETGNWKVPANTDIRYTHFSPKVGLSYNFTNSLNMFLSYRHGFRVPSEGQLFRQGSAVNTVGLEPVKVNSYESGIRGAFDFFEYELSAYYMTKKDDILNFRNPVTDLNESLNAGETSHKGIETGIRIQIMEKLSFNAVYAYSIHKYEEWIVSGIASYSGNEMETAPREIGNFRINYDASIVFISLELVRLGNYWMDPANTVKYPGHNLLNFRFNLPIWNAFELYGSLFNLTDKRFAESASYTPQRGEEFAPGMPRSFNLGLTYKLN
ncbi:MAG TPA: TonB-dependent receptor, partial [Ignavibacteriaceae bacterium]|nr:TonB-dependent receptor [Ignavibacteriaceae bacterium]